MLYKIAHEVGSDETIWYLLVDENRDSSMLNRNETFEMYGGFFFLSFFLWRVQNQRKIQ
jgi:hypothetical protein